MGESVLELLSKGSVCSDHSNFFFGRDLGRPSSVVEDEYRCTYVHSVNGRCVWRATEPGGLCLDHQCPCCKGLKMPRKAICSTCDIAGRKVLRQNFDGFACSLEQPFGALDSAYHKLTGEFALFHWPIRPTRVKSGPEVGERC